MKAQRLQEVADHYGMFIYAAEDKIVAGGSVVHGFTCDYPKRAVAEAVTAMYGSQVRRDALNSKERK